MNLLNMMMIQENNFVIDKFLKLVTARSFNFLVVIQYKLDICINLLIKLNKKVIKSNINLNLTQVMKVEEHEVADSNNLMAQPFYLPTGFSLEMKLRSQIP